MIVQVKGYLHMNELTDKYREEFKDKETRDIYADDFLNTFIATQIKVLREKRGWTQAVLAEKAGMKQERISVLEDVNHEAWTANVLKRLAKAFDLRLSIKFETFGSFLSEFENFSREALERSSFDDDLEFHGIPQTTSTAVFLDTNVMTSIASFTEILEGLQETVARIAETLSTNQEVESEYKELKGVNAMESVPDFIPPQSTITDYTSSKLPF